MLKGENITIFKILYIIIITGLVQVLTDTLSLDALKKTAGTDYLHIYFVHFCPFDWFPV
jgi:hypothetical protein